MVAKCYTSYMFQWLIFEFVRSSSSPFYTKTRHRTSELGFCVKSAPVWPHLTQTRVISLRLIGPACDWVVDSIIVFGITWESIWDLCLHLGLYWISGLNSYIYHTIYWFYRSHMIEFHLCYNYWLFKERRTLTRNPNMRNSTWAERMNGLSGRFQQCQAHVEWRL